MTADVYARIYCAMRVNPKIMALPDGAYRLYMEAILWSVENLTDGFIPDRALTLVTRQTRRVGTRRAGTLVDAGVWEARPDGWQIHDFDDHQRTRQEIEERHEKRRSAGRKGGQVSARKRAGAQASAYTGGNQPLQASAGREKQPIYRYREVIHHPTGGDTVSSDKQVDDDDGIPDRTTTELTATAGLAAAAETITANRVGVANPGGYRRRVLDQLAADHATLALDLAAAGQTPEAIAAAVAAAHQGTPTARPEDETAKAQLAMMTRHCDRCGGSGMLLGEDDMARPCDWCNRQTVAS